MIDDDVGTAELTRVVLEDSGFAVTVQMTSDHLPDGPFDCVVSDVMTALYAYDDARDWILRLADRYPGVPVILVTAHIAARHDAGRLPARRVIVKPFDVDLLAAAVREAIA